MKLIAKRGMPHRIEIDGRGCYEYQFVAPKRKHEKLRLVYSLERAIETGDHNKANQLRQELFGRKYVVKKGEPVIDLTCKYIYRLSNLKGEVVIFRNRDEVRDFLRCKTTAISILLETRERYDGWRLERIANRMRPKGSYIAISPEGEKYASSVMGRLSKVVPITMIGSRYFKNGGIKVGPNKGWEFKIEEVKESDKGEYTWL